MHGPEDEMNRGCGGGRSINLKGFKRLLSSFCSNQTFRVLNLMRNYQGDRCLEDCCLEMGSQICLNFGNIYSNAASAVWVMKKLKTFSSDKYIQLIG